MRELAKVFGRFVRYVTNRVKIEICRVADSGAGREDRSAGSPIVKDGPLLRRPPWRLHASGFPPQVFG